MDSTQLTRPGSNRATKPHTGRHRKKDRPWLGSSLVFWLWILPPPPELRQRPHTALAKLARVFNLTANCNVQGQPPQERQDTFFRWHEPQVAWNSFGYPEVAGKCIFFCLPTCGFHFPVFKPTHIPVLVGCTMLDRHHSDSDASRPPGLVRRSWGSNKATGLKFM